MAFELLTRASQGLGPRDKGFVHAKTCELGRVEVAKNALGAWLPICHVGLRFSFCPFFPCLNTSTWNLQTHHTRTSPGFGPQLTELLGRKTCGGLRISHRSGVLKHLLDSRLQTRSFAPKSQSQHNLHSWEVQALYIDPRKPRWLTLKLSTNSALAA